MILSICIHNKFDNNFNSNLKLVLTSMYKEKQFFDRICTYV